MFVSTFLLLFGLFAQYAVKRCHCFHRINVDLVVLVSTSATGQPGRGTAPVPPMARVFVMPNMMAATSGMTRAGAEAQVSSLIIEELCSFGSSYRVIQNAEL